MGMWVGMYMLSALSHFGGHSPWSIATQAANKKL